MKTIMKSLVASLFVFGTIGTAMTPVQAQSSAQLDSDISVIKEETKESAFFASELPVKKMDVKKKTAERALHKESKEKEKTSQNVKRTVQVEATAYTAHCDGCTGITKTGINLLKNPNKKVIAVDPDVIPLGSEVYVEGYGRAVAGDIGSAIQGNRVDLYMKNHNDAIDYGRRHNVTVKILS